MASTDSLDKYLDNSRPAVVPQIYGYILPTVSDHDGYIKIGYTDKADVEERIKEQLHTATIKHKTLFAVSAMRPDGSIFNDKEIHARLVRYGKKKMFFDGDKNNEWIECSEQEALSAINEIRDYTKFEKPRDWNFQMRDEQQDAVDKTYEYFTKFAKEEPDQKPKYLWNAKMRFGKTFATYELAKKMDMKRVLVLTFKPAVESAWEEDLDRHVDFDGWQFVSNKQGEYDKTKLNEMFAKCDKKKPIVVFGSFQDLLGTNEFGGIKAKNEFIHKEKWDMVVFDEYHFGAWRDNAKKLFEKQSDEDVDFDVDAYQKDEAGNAWNETWLKDVIETKYFLYLSGTPFRALNTGEFLEEQIFNWTYSQEQERKATWDYSRGDNPYASLPRMVMLTYKIPDSITEVARNEGYDEFDINEFFKAEPKDGDVKKSEFIYKDNVQRWIDLLIGKGNFTDGLKLGNDKPPMPYSDANLLGYLTHTLWFLPNVASCNAMANLLHEPQNKFFIDYKIVVCAGVDAGVGLDALEPVLRAMDDPLKSKTITLSCGKLTTGVTVKPWSGVFMLRNLKSPETYFQTAFRVQSPWVIKDEDGKDVIMKKECYVFDFALERALRQISDYSKLAINDDSLEKKVTQFIKFLPVLAYDGAGMNQISATDVLDFTYNGASATLLARRWQTALLVHVDNETLKKLQSNKEALDALNNLEGFRKLNETIQTIINKSEKIKKAKTTGENLSPKGKKELSEEEKEMKSLRKQVQENLLKLAARIPAFMYLTDYREQTLKDVITQIEPALFKKVTGLNVKDFELLCSIGLFDAEKMNSGIFGFRRYENSSLSYAGIDKHEGENVGGWDTVLTQKEYEELYAQQQATLTNFIEAIVPTDEGKKSKVKVAYSVDKNKDLEKKRKQLQKILDTVKTGAKVKHNKFGEGIVIGIKDRGTKIIIEFDEGRKTFLFPESFMQGLLKVVED